MEQNQTLGSGELHFAKFLAGTQTPGGERYLGNSTEFNLNFASEALQHWDRDHGLAEVDKSVNTRTTRSGSLITDNVSYENLALYFFGSTSALTVTAGAVASEPIAKVVRGLSYPVGVTANNPVGVRNIDPATPVVVRKGATTFVAGTDYVFDYERGRLTITESGGTIISGDDITIGYTTLASTRTRVISGRKPIEGALRYLAFNAVGLQIDWYMPSVRLSPNGDFALKAEEWQTIPFSVEILKKPNVEAVYIDGQPYVPS